MCTAAPPLVSRNIHRQTFDDMASSSAILFAVLCVLTTASASSADAQRLLEEEADHDEYSDLAPEPDPTTAEAYTPPATPEKEKKKGCGEAPMTWRMTVLRWLYWFSKFGTGGAI